MYQAPHVPMTGRFTPHKGGLAGVAQTVGAMRALADKGKCNPALRAVAVNTIFMTPERDELHECTAIFELVRDHIRYVKDVAGVETLSAPEYVLACRIGDCDDKSLLLSALLESVGYPTRFVIAGYGDEGAAGQAQHVYLQVQVDGEWLDCDATESGPLGWAPPDPTLILVEDR